MEVKLCLLGIYNDILATGVVPQRCNRIKVVPVLKLGKGSLLLGSYRPISLLASSRKFMEKMICIRLDFWAEKNGILGPTQYGCRKTGISTSFEMKKQTVAAFLDISGAYNNVLIYVYCDARKEDGSGNCPIYVGPAVV
jgi:hypothetical protein